jgi:hypothetical protein
VNWKFSGFTTLSFTEHDAYSLFLPIKSNILFFFFLYLKGISFSFSQGRKKLKVLGKFQAISLVHAVVNVKTRGFPNLYLQQK